MAETGGSSPAMSDLENIDAVSAAAGNAADNKEEPKARRNRMRMLAERKRQDREKNYFAELQALMPHVTDKNQKKASIVGHAIDYIQSLEKKKAMLEKRKQQLALERQAAAEGVAASSSSAPPPQAAAKAMAAAAAMLSSDVIVVPDGCHDVPVLPPLQQPLAAAVPVSADAPQPLAAAAAPAPPQQLPMAAGFKTWSWKNLVLNVSNGDAYINVCAPRHLGTQTMVMVVSVLNKHGIDVVTAQADSDAVRSVFNIFARVTGMGGQNPSSEEVYKLAMSEILLFLNTI